jgi:diacylglycerol kinase (ATP)
MRVILMHNPNAGDEQHSRDWLVALIRDAGHDVLYQSTEDDAWAAALAQPADLVVVAGGDGTVQRVFTELPGRGLPATVLPLGSANNIARTLGVADDDPAWLARSWHDGRRRPYDIGRVRWGAGEARFVESLGGGLFGEVLLRAADRDGNPPDEDKRELGLELLKDVIDEAEATPWDLSLDGVDRSGDFLAVEAMNIREIGPNLPLAPGADPGDRLLDLVLIGPEHRGLLAGVVEALLEERPARPWGLPAMRGRRLRIHLPEGCPLHLDDDVWPGPSGREPDGTQAAIGDERIEVVLPAR